MANRNKITFLVPTLGTRIMEITRLLDSLNCQTSKDFEVVIVSQGNYDEIGNLVNDYSDKLNITLVCDNGIGLSRARNIGIKSCNGEYIAISDDDCWYPEQAVEEITSLLSLKKSDILLTQIYDPINKVLYKNYSSEESIINSKIQLLSKSSIEIVFRNEKDILFDEQFGLGAHYTCCEEIDFLIRKFKAKKRIVYHPYISVYHMKKTGKTLPNNVVAKGALYRKDFDFFTALLIVFRDLIIKHENNFMLFFEGYFGYAKGIN